MHEQLTITKNLPIAGAYDVVVCGGGPAGCAAALSARRAGLTVLVVESQGQLGGMGTSGLVAHWLGGRTADGGWVVGGIFRELAEEAAAAGIALLPTRDTGVKYQPHGWLEGLVHGVPFDPFAMAALLDSKFAAAAIEVRFGTQAIDTIVVENRITHILLANKDGLQAVAAHAVIDATGDADIAARSGCAICAGREDDGLMTPATLMFHVDNVDQEALAADIRAHDQPRFRELIGQLRAQGAWPFPYDIFISVQLTEPGTMMINTSRLCEVNGIDNASLSEAYRRGRAETQQQLDVLRRHFPGFAHARLKAVAPLLGVRETRRIVGEYIMTVDDAINGMSVDDAIGFSCYGWDLPDPKRPSHQPMHGVRKASLTPMPYRILVPQPVTNLICPGRVVSVERDVLGPLRVMAPVMAMGEAAGTAAAQVVREETTFAAIDTEALRAELRRRNAIIDLPA